MSLLSSALFNFKGQSVQSVTLEASSHSVLVKCKRDRRCKVVDPETGKPRTVDHYVQRRLSDLPVSGRPCVIEIELAQTRDNLGRRLIEATDFVDKGGRYTKRFCHFISGLWVDHGRTSNVLINFFEQLSPQTRDGIQVVSMDMGQSYQSAVRKVLPNADIVFDRFHIMQNYSLLIRKERNKRLGKERMTRKKVSAP
ncbi:Transposase [Vibrio mediterranei]|nr:Transposase [Vibrio mediterranei]